MAQTNLEFFAVILSGITGDYRPVPPGMNVYMYIIFPYINFRIVVGL